MICYMPQKDGVIVDSFDFLCVNIFLSMKLQFKEFNLIQTK